GAPGSRMGTRRLRRWTPPARWGTGVATAGPPPGLTSWADGPRAPPAVGPPTGRPSSGSGLLLRHALPHALALGDGAAHLAERGHDLLAAALGDAALGDLLTRPAHRLAEHLAGFPRSEPRELQRRPVRAAVLLQAEHITGRHEEAGDLRRHRAVATGETSLALAGGRVEARLVAALRRLEDAGCALIAAVPREERASGAQAAGAVAGAARVRGAAGAVVDVPAAAARIEQVVRAGVEVVAAVRRERVDGAAL